MHSTLLNLSYLFLLLILARALMSGILATVSRLLAFFHPSATFVRMENKELEDLCRIAPYALAACALIVILRLLIGGGINAL